MPRKDVALSESFTLGVAGAFVKVSEGGGHHVVRLNRDRKSPLVLNRTADKGPMSRDNVLCRARSCGMSTVY